jgi:hypothetical protein
MEIGCGLPFFSAGFLELVAKLSGVGTALLLQAVEEINQDQATFTTKLVVQERRC